MSNTISRNQKVRWGILGTGKIAAKFAEQLSKILDAQLIGVASRDFKNAQLFCKKYPAARAFESYEALCEDSDIDVVYVCTPTCMHFEHCNLVLDSNKALLCEKPFTRNFSEALEIIQKAQRKQIFCMEAMWMRFNPCIQYAKYAIDENQIGKVCTLHAELGYQKDLNILASPANGRGAALTFGCYTISVVTYLFGKPNSVSSHIICNSYGGDETGALLFHYSDKVASVFYSEGSTLSNKVSIYAQEGSIHINDSFINAPSVDIINLKQIKEYSIAERFKVKFNRTVNRYDRLLNQIGSVNKYDNSGLKREAEEVIKCLRLGLSESEIMPLHQTLLTHEILQPILFPELKDS